ncbi:hypothetical protein PMZ80_008242 [Knufia obscura]|uniref:IBR domain-containing protein n=1 Tax=Knufia obscura TaxID=1635080 RepID=A0ABR0RHY6_9EURO|nr:hypothetical protein PMZ80_008242 [Knufia obscura]
MAKKRAAKQSNAREVSPATPIKQAAGTKRKRNDETSTTPKRAAKVAKQEMQDCDIYCYKTHFVTKIDADRALGWLACNCPLCAEPVDEEDVRGVLPRTLGKELAAMIKQAQKSAAINWLWCPAEGCGHGQLHNLTNIPYVTCSQCQTKICKNHQRRWHEGMTCHEFDEVSNHDEAAKKDMDEVRRTTKPCPFCKMRVKKEGNDVPFDGEQQGDSAEILGGPQGAASLGGDARQAVEQVMRFENAAVDNARRPLPLETPIALPRLDPRIREPDQALGVLQAMRQTIAGVTRRFGPNPPPAPRAPAIPVLRDVSPIDRGFLWGTFDGVRDLIRRPAPVSALRSTQPQSRQDAIIIAEDTDSVDSLDEEDNEVPARTVYVPQAPQPRTRPRARPSQQVIDLTNDDDDDDHDDDDERIVIDLTGDDE